MKHDMKQLTVLPAQAGITDKDDAAGGGVLARLPLAYFREKSGYHWFVVGTVCVGAFMAALDASIVNVAMPTLTKTFAGGMNTVEWVSIAYLLTLTSLLTMLGSLADRLGRRTFPPSASACSSSVPPFAARPPQCST